MTYGKYVLAALTCITVVALSSISYGAAMIFVTSQGDSSYALQGAGLNGVAGIQLDITYDATSLQGTPTVTQGGLVSGAMFAANTSRPGSIKIAIISTTPFSASGQIATISFASKTGNGGITAVTASMIDASGANIAATVSNTTGQTTMPASTPIQGLSSNPTTPATTTVPTTTTTTTTAPSTTTSPTSQTGQTTTPTYLGAVTLPTDQQQRPESQAAQASTPPAIIGESAPARTEQSQPSAKPSPETTKPEETPQYVVYKGALDRMKLMDDNTPFSTLLALFDKKVAQNIQQEPAILLSDGQSKAALTVNLPARIANSPNFAVNGGTLLSFRQEKQIKGRWIVEVLPNNGVTKASLTIIAGAEEFEFPLTVAPLLKTQLPLNEEGWNTFTKDSGSAEDPHHDFNGDGVRDYLDKYIFIVNYLAQKALPVKPAAALKKPLK